MKVSFIGDISLNDNYIELYKNGVNPFELLEPILSSSDFVLGNLECIAKGEQGENELKKPRLTTTVETLNFLKNIHLKGAFLAQNHIYDHLEDGYNKTTKFLDDNGIKRLGTGKSFEEAEKPLILTQDGISVALLNYVTTDTNPNMPTDSRVCLNIFDLEKCKKDIKQLRSRVNHIVLSLHWGGRVEGGLYPDWDQPKLARKLIDAGADLIIGHHSHTIQPYEIYKKKHIFYSLGNFCFSDYTFENKFVPMPQRRNITMILNIDFMEQAYTLKTENYLNKGDHFVLLPYYSSSIKLKNILFKYFLRYRLFWNTYFFNKRRLLPFFLFMTRKDLNLSQKIKRITKSIKK